MILISFNPKALAGKNKTIFENWQKLAAKAQKQLDESVKQGQSANFNSKIWSALKQFLLANVFHGKCAYCEINIDAGFVGDAEHYRPKGGITEIQNSKMIRVAGPRGDHPGYYWVAYDWQNLIPSCQRCNSVNGKRMQFPIEGNRAHSPSDADTVEALNNLEMPLLLHPYDHERAPRDHLLFTPDGAVTALTKAGAETIRALDLDRPALREQRRMHITCAKNSLAARISYAILEHGPNELQAAIEKVHGDLSSPRQPCSAAVTEITSTILQSFNRAAAALIKRV